MSGRWRADLARALGAKSLRDNTKRVEGDLERALGRHLEARGIAVVPGAMSPEDEARAQRQLRLAEVQAALLPTPPLPGPAPADPQPSTADVIRGLIAQQADTAALPLNGQALLDHAARQVTASRDDTATDLLEQLLRRTR